MSHSLTSLLANSTLLLLFCLVVFSPVCGLDISTNSPEAISLNTSRTFSVMIIDDTSIVNDSSICYLDVFEESKTGASVYSGEVSEATDLSYVFTIPASAHTSKGEYSYRVACVTATASGFTEGKYYVTANGFMPAGDFVTTLIYLLFLISGVMLMYSLIINLAKLATLSTTLYDVLLAWGGIILVLLVIYLGENYMLSTYIESLGHTFLSAVVISNGVFPAFALFLSFIIRLLKDKKDGKKFKLADFTGREFRVKSGRLLK